MYIIYQIMYITMYISVDNFSKIAIFNVHIFLICTKFYIFNVIKFLMNVNNSLYI